MKIRDGFAAVLSATRRHKNLTQEDFSDISGRTYLSSLERGIKSPTLDKIDQLASVLEVHPATLILLAYATAEKCSAEKIIKQIINEVQLLTK